VLLTYPWEFPQPAEVDRSDLDYYTPRYDPDGPAMTDSVNSVIAAQLGIGCSAWTYTLRSLDPFVKAPYEQFTEARSGQGVRRPRAGRVRCARCVPEASTAEGGLMMSGGGEQPDRVSLTNLDQPLFDGADATKRDLVDYLDAVADHIIPELADRPLSVIRVLRGQAPFMQKNVPSYTPSWVRTVSLWAETSKREVSYALCNDRRTLLWFANQRAVEYHPTLIRADHWDRPTHLVLDLDPPSGDTFGAAVRATMSRVP
jgi:hypothetical protein